MSRRCLNVVAVVLGLAAAGLLPPRIEAAVTFETAQFDRDLQALTKNPHRLAGRVDGSLAASRYVEQRLREIGFDSGEIFVQEFPVIQPRHTECHLVLDGQSYPILAMRPNLLQASVTPAQGLTGQVVYAGKGEVPDYGDNFPAGKIVVLDFNCGLNWLDAFAFGAKAVLFVGPKPGSDQLSQPLHHINMPANLPRFYVPHDLADRLGLRNADFSGELTIRAAAKWEQLRGRNVIGVLRGTDPVFQEDRAGQAVVLAAPLDSYSEVPELAPGARDAGNIAALLQIAEHLYRNRPRRDVLLCFFDGQTVNHQGAREFYGAIMREKPDEGDPSEHEERLEELAEQQVFYSHLNEVYEQPSLLSSEAKEIEHWKAAKAMLRDEAKSFSSIVLEKLRPHRIKRSEVDARLRSAQNENLHEQAKQLEAILVELNADIEELAIEDRAWNTLQRILHKELDYKDAAVLAEVFAEIEEPARTRLVEITPTRFAQLVAHAQRLCRRRLGELEVEIADTRKAQELFEAFGPLQNRIVLHLSLNLSDARSRWTFIHGDDSAPVDLDNTGNYNSIFKAMREIRRQLGSEMAGFEDLAISTVFDNRLFAPGRFVDSGPLARIFAIFNLSAMTVLDRMPRQGLPTDTLDVLNSQILLDQARELAGFLKPLLDDEGLNVQPKTRQNANFGYATWAGNKSTGATVRRRSATGAMEAHAMRNVVVAISHNENWAGLDVTLAPPGFIWTMLCKTDSQGIFQFGAHSRSYYSRGILVAAEFDKTLVEETDDLTNRVYTSRGLVALISNQETLAAFSNNLIKSHSVIVAGQPKTIVGYGFERGTTATLAMRAISTAPFRGSEHMLAEWRNVLFLHAPPEAKGAKLFHSQGMVLLKNTATRKGYQGKGISLADPFEHPPVFPGTTQDLRRLNQFRLKLLREVRIHQESLEVLTGTALDMESDALKDKAQHSTDWFYGTMAAASSFSRRVYSPLVGVLNDLVTAVVLLLLLTIPFAYALERLLVGTPHIYRQIGWFLVFFLLTFMLLFAVNPAFKIAATPIIIFLAFAIILLSAMVILILIRKLQAEIRKMQGLAATVHSADVSRLSTMLAAIHMGISTMRRRPLRTFLTAATVVLLTFTVLTFASFGSSWDIWSTYQGTTSGAPRILVRHALWSPVGKSRFDLLRGFLSEEAMVVPRYWASPTAQQAQDAVQQGKSLEMFLCNAAGEHLTPMAAAIGVDTRDLDMQESLRAVLAGQGQAEARIDLLIDKPHQVGDGIFLTQAVADELELTAEDLGKIKVYFAGMELTYAGIVRDVLATYTLLEGSSALPVDYEASAGESAEKLTSTMDALAETPDVESAQFVPYNVDRVAIVSPETAKLLGATIRSITIYPKEIDGIRDTARTIAKVVELPVYVGDAKGVSRMIFTTVAKASGWRDLLVPVILGGLIIFATMLGSVSDREREIYTFSSLGLAPAHVASLFFAEASMYAVVGGMGGYLLGQISARLLGWLSAEFGWSVPTMNYSSTNAIVTIMIVMATAMISTIYPAMKASRSANPGIQRAWKIPKPEGDLYDLIFPFTVSAYDITGVVSFLKEHFDNFSDTSLGVFATTKCHVFRQKQSDMLGFRATVALAPFDLGVNEDFAVLSQPSEIQGIHEVRIFIRRLSGAGGDWQRANRVFINDLRKQLLIWRSLPHETMDRYRQQTLEQWDRLPLEQIDPETFGESA